MHQAGPPAQDAAETADGNSFNSAVSKLGISARPTDPSGAPNYTNSSASDDDDDYTLSDSGAHPPSPFPPDSTGAPPLP